MTLYEAFLEQADFTRTFAIENPSRHDEYHRAESEDREYTARCLTVEQAEKEYKPRPPVVIDEAAEEEDIRTFHDSGWRIWMEYEPRTAKSF